MLATGALLFTNSASTLVIEPIESMITKVNRISKNPLLAAQEEENEALAMEKYDEEKSKGNYKNAKKLKGPLLET